MAEYKVILPAMGESIMEAQLIKWLREEGDYIKKEEILLEIATDKVDSEVPSPIEGILKKKLAQEGEVIKVGAPFAIMEKKESIKEDPKKHLPLGQEKKQRLDDPLDQDRFFSPLIKNIAQKEGINQKELLRIQGNGKGGRITKEDLIFFLEEKKKSTTTPLIKEEKIEGLDSVPLQERIKMDRTRKIIALHMIESKKISPHVSSFIEADLTNVVLWREKIKKEWKDQKISFMAVFIWAVIKAIKDFPLINSSIEGDDIIIKKEINIGIATALPNGNVIVPVIKQADRYNIRGLNEKVNDLAFRAKAYKLHPEEIQNGTYTITNIGSFGNLMGTPIIHQPQVAILAVGNIEKKPSIIETPQGDSIGIRHKMYLSHSYDHRIIDGAIGCGFLKNVAQYLASFPANTII